MSAHAGSTAPPVRATADGLAAAPGRDTGLAGGPIPRFEDRFAPREYIGSKNTTALPAHHSSGGFVAAGGYVARHHQAGNADQAPARHHQARDWVPVLNRAIIAMAVVAGLSMMMRWPDHSNIEQAKFTRLLLKPGNME